MGLKTSSILVVVAGILAVAWYAVEPWAVTFVDDGPYYSREFSGSIVELPIYSQIELRRFGLPVYSLESRLLSSGDESVVVLRDTGGSVQWARIPLKPDGELGPLELRRANPTWYGGWRIGIKPDNQEGGYLYLGTFGGFRFFNHSW
ncbi:MAG: hypothetical protein OEQ90_05820 [Gammaproteobacteria bacterium]|nr:hypothetical protein [Gammaproteobacteria bacterium]